ncbi:Peroxidase N1 [Vitis vinifera]|uniref:peroxidase n=1 Tax=Vitis vinifera TaxID=29760 RepID=A0A438GRS2_VITVI|nr:Peroxidase N1 [Vitis vinifera]
MAAALVQGQGTRVGFYSRTCPQVESIVQKTVNSHFQSNPAIAPGLLRMHFHDCFVQGCDASILIDGSVHRENGWAKSVYKRTNVESATGRRDGRVSLASNVNNLPGPRDSVEVQKKKFADKGLNDQIWLLLLVRIDTGTMMNQRGHTIGTAACQAFRYRLYNFSTTTANGADPSMDATFVTQLQALCPANGDASRRVALDTDASTKTFFSAFLGVRGLRGLNFNLEFGRSMCEDEQHWGEDWTLGEIRKVCSAIN